MSTVKLPRSIYLWLRAHDPNLTPAQPLKAETGRGKHLVEVNASEAVAQALVDRVHALTATGGSKRAEDFGKALDKVSAALDAEAAA